MEELTENRCACLCLSPDPPVGQLHCWPPPRLAAAHQRASLHSHRRSLSRRNRNACACLCSFEGVDIALFSAGGSISKKLGPVAAAKGVIVRGAGRVNRCCGPRGGGPGGGGGGGAWGLVWGRLCVQMDAPKMKLPNWAYSQKTFAGPV